MRRFPDARADLDAAVAAFTRLDTTTAALRDIGQAAAAMGPAFQKVSHALDSLYMLFEESMGVQKNSAGDPICDGCLAALHLFETGIVIGDTVEHVPGVRKIGNTYAVIRYETGHAIMGLTALLEEPRIQVLTLRRFHTVECVQRWLRRRRGLPDA